VDEQDDRMPASPAAMVASLSDEELRGLGLTRLQAQVLVQYSAEEILDFAVLRLAIVRLYERTSQDHQLADIRERLDELRQRQQELLAGSEGMKYVAN